MIAKEIICWQPVLTDHQAYTFAALGRAGSAAINVYSMARSDDIRALQGWSEAQTRGLTLRIVPRIGWFKAISQIFDSHPDAIHIFGSPFENPKFMVALCLALMRHRNVYLLSEPYSTISEGYFDDDRRILGQLKARLRPLVYQMYLLPLRTRIRGVFAISRRAVRQFRELGVPADRVFPFGYFVPQQPMIAKNDTRSEHRCRVSVIFLGSLIKRKGVIDLVHAIEILVRRGIDVFADVYGPGDASKFSTCAGRISYRGILPFGKSQQYIKDYDLLVLPSRYDGWGVVVNEALQSGVPVVCSDQVGAGAMLEKWACGKVFPAGNAVGLADVVMAIASSDRALTDMRAGCGLVRKYLEPSFAGEYMSNIIYGPHVVGELPTCVWYRE